MNGALGVIRRPTATGALVSFDDGTNAELLRRDLVLALHVLELHTARKASDDYGDRFDSLAVPVQAELVILRSLPCNSVVMSSCETSARSVWLVATM
jgi:hypothetical protein